jgi:hypothetical protein
MQVKRAVVVGTRQKAALYALTGLVWLSGVLWLYFRYFGRVQTEFGLQAHPAQGWCLEVHGAVAMLFLILLGTFIPNHIRLGWHQNRQRPSGVSLLTMCGILILTGWGLYYLGNESLRRSTSLLHSVLGALLPVVIAVHVWFARRNSKVPHP